MPSPTPQVTSIRSSELVRSFPLLREAALAQPVSITHHGRVTHVLLGHDLYERLRARADPRSAEPGAGTACDAYDLADWMDEALLVCDPQLRVLFINRAARQLVQPVAARGADTPLHEIAPQLNAGFVGALARQTLRTRQACAAELPSPFADAGSLRAECFMLGEHVVIKLRSITEEIAAHAIGERADAIRALLSAHPCIGFARLSVRATIEEVNPAFCAFVALPAQRLKGLALVDLAATADKPRLREAIESALSLRQPAQAKAGLVNNDGGLTELRMVIAGLRGVYGADGAMMLATHPPSEAASPRADRDSS